MIRLALTVAASLGMATGTAFAQDVTGALSLERFVQADAQPAPALRPWQGQRLTMASLPSQQISAVRETTEAGGFHQVIELDRAGPGLQPNMIDVHYSRTMIDGDVATLQKPTEAGIREELSTRFPGMTMMIVDRPRSNAYGVYGLAAGKRVDGTRCLYGWQWTDTAEMQGVSDSFDALSIRVSLCRNGVTLDELASTLDRLHVGPTRVAIQPTIARPTRVAAASVRRMPRRIAANITRPAVSRAATIPTTLVSPVVTISPILAAMDPGLDPSLPAAAYQGPNRQAQLQVSTK